MTEIDLNNPKSNLRWEVEHIPWNWKMEDESFKIEADVKWERLHAPNLLLICKWDNN